MKVEFKTIDGNRISVEMDSVICHEEEKDKNMKPFTTIYLIGGYIVDLDIS